MSITLDDMFGGLGGNQATYTIEEIDAAKKRQKKHGGTLYENLEIVAPGKKASTTPSASFDTDLFQNAKKDFDAASDALDQMQKTTQQMVVENNKTIQSLMKDIAKDEPILDTSSISDSIKEMNANLKYDFGQATKKDPASSISADSSTKEAEVTTDPAKALEGFQGITDYLKEKIVGQDDFLKKLVIAFKRPFVQEAGEQALNSFYVTGPSDTGKHYALDLLVKELFSRKLLKSDSISTMNLALYPSAGEEKLFLQDLYSALQSKSQVIVFENYELCHISMLNRLSELVSTGKCNLSERYVMQNGQLINVANAFAGQTVGSFEAKGNYLVFLSTRPVDKLAGVMGAPFVNALGDICVTATLSEDALSTVAKEHEAKLMEACKKQLGYNITIEESFSAYMLSKADRSKSLKDVLEGYATTSKALSELRLERDDLSTNDLSLICKDGVPLIVAGEEEISMAGLLPNDYKGELESVKAEMDSIVGLKEVKEYIYGLEEYFGVQKRRREAGLAAGEVNKHMIFTGNPGTGKTTIARIVSKYLKAIGVLSGGQLVEVSRADLVGRYVGHTAPLVNQVVKSAIGGVLFIDEAYSLHRENEDSFGLEAVDALVKGIEDNRDDLIVILAGYSKEMEEFLQSNSGLKSRFPNIIDFPDYTGDELIEIAKLTAKGKGYVIDEGALPALLTYFNLVQATRARDAGNGRLVRNKVEEAILNQSRRLVAEKDADLSTLLSQDFELEDVN